MTVSLLAIIVALAASVNGSVDNPDNDQAGSVARGQFTTTFTDRSPLSKVEKQLVRFQWKRDRPQPKYDLSQESFNVYVPQEYTVDQSYGLLVWMSAFERGLILHPRIQSKHKLITIASNNVANPRNIFHRSGLVLDAVHNIKQLYNIDPNRIYVSGFSKGGRMASCRGIVYADVFNGAFPIDGTDWWHHLEDPNNPDQFFRGRFRRPGSKLLRKARTEDRYVLMTGENDGNRDQTRVFYTSTVLFQSLS